MKTNCFKIGKSMVGQGKPCFFIAEVGPNHNGSLDNAKKLIFEAKKSGCNAIKFQYHIAEEEIADKSTKIPWVNVKRYDFIKNVQEFTFNEHNILRKYSKKLGLEYISSPFNLKAARNLLKLGVDAFKIASGEITNFELIEFCLKSKKPIIISTGMSDKKEIERTVNFIKKFNNKKIILMQCTSQYPTMIKDVNLSVISFFKKNYQFVVGLSDHCESELPAISSVCYGSKCIEKHFTLNTRMKGPDHKVSFTPKKMKDFIKNVKIVESAIGCEEKRIDSRIKKVRNVFLNSVVTSKNLVEGDLISLDNITFKKPGTGILSSDYQKILGCKVKKDLKKNHILTLKDLEKK